MSGNRAQVRSERIVSGFENFWFDEPRALSSRILRGAVARERRRSR
jgi:hypothetical protein